MRIVLIIVASLLATSAHADEWRNGSVWRGEQYRTGDGTTHTVWQRPQQRSLHCRTSMWRGYPQTTCN